MSKGLMRWDRLPVCRVRSRSLIGVPHVSELDDDGQPMQVSDDEAWTKSAIFLAYGSFTE